VKAIISSSFLSSGRLLMIGGVYPRVKKQTDFLCKITVWNSGLFEKLTAALIVKKFSTIYEI
jgi:hypothetical protein